jgi:Fe-S oxidoreductase
MTDDASGSAKAAFSYAEHFGTMRVLGEVLRDPAHRPWLTSVPKDAPHHRYVLWLGCNILRTVHLAETLDDILAHLQVDVATLGGPSNCCGIVHEAQGDTAVSTNMLRQTMSKFDAFTPEQMLCWCPSCDNQLRKAGAVTETAEKRISVTRFLATELPRMTLNPVTPMKVAIHAHPGYAEQEADGADARLVLSQIPGIEIIEAPPVRELGRHCTDADIATFGKSAYLDGMKAWIANARAQGATHAVSIYHSCHRQMALAQRDWADEARMPLINYLTLLARALGLPEREDKFTRFADAANVDAIMAEVEPNARALAIKPEQVRRAVAAQFQRSTAHES